MLEKQPWKAQGFAARKEVQTGFLHSKNVKSQHIHHERHKNMERAPAWQTWWSHFSPHQYRGLRQPIPKFSLSK